nr:hypothetical protein [Tanacetum cinerariifolium]
MSRDMLTIGSTMRIPLLYRGEYSQWSEMFMNFFEEQTDGEAMINSIKNGDQPLPRVTQVSIVRTSSTKQPPLKDKSIWSDQEKKIQKIDRLAISLLIQGLSKDIYSLIDKWKQYVTRMRHNKNLMDINIDALYNILKQNQRDVIDAMGLKKKIDVVTSDPLALIAKKTQINENMVYMAQIKKVLLDLEASSSSADDKIVELAVDHNDSEETAKLINQMIKEFDKQIVKYQKRLEKANQQNKDFENQNKDLQDKYDVLKIKLPLLRRKTMS